MRRRKKRSIRPFEFLTNVEGMNEDDGVFRIQPSAAELIQNLHPNKAGEYTAYNQGYEAYTSELESGAEVDSLGSFTNDSGSSYFLAAINGKVLNINSATGANDGTVTSSNTAGNSVDFQAFKGSVYLVEKSMTPEVWTGSGSASAVSAIPLTVGLDVYDKPSMVEAYKNRLVYGNFNGTTKYPSHIAISDDLAPDTFTIGSSTTNGAVIQINPGDGQHLRAMRTLYIPSQADSYLICFKDNSVYAVSGNTPNTSGDTFAVTLVSGSTGVLNNRCVVQVGSDLLYMDKKGIYSLSTATQSGTLQPVAIGSEKVQDTLATMNVAEKDKAWAVHLPSRYEVWFGFPTGSSTVVNKILVYNYRKARENQHVWIVRTAMNATCGMEFDGEFYTGTTTGYLMKWFSSSTYNGTGYNWIYRYPYYNFGTQAQHKRLLECFADVFVRKTTTVNIKTKWRLGGNNTENTFTKTLTLDSGSTYGVGTYGSTAFSTIGGSMRKIQIPVIGNGEQLQLEISGTTDGLGPTFLGFTGLVEFGGYDRSYR